MTVMIKIVRSFVMKISILVMNNIPIKLKKNLVLPNYISNRAKRL